MQFKKVKHSNKIYTKIYH